MPPTLPEVIAAAEQTFTFLTEDELASEAKRADAARASARVALLEAEEAAANFRAIIGHAENWKRAVAYAQERKMLAREKPAPHPCEVPGCTRTASAAKRTCARHHVGDIAAAAPAA